MSDDAERLNGEGRLAADTFRLPGEKIRSSYYSDTYFALTKELLEARDEHPRVTMQVFAKRRGLLGGIDEGGAILRPLPRGGPPARGAASGTDRGRTAGRR